MAQPQPADKKRPAREGSGAPADATTFQRWSAPLLVGLSGLPRWAFIIVLAAVLFAGLAIPGIVGGLLLLLIALFLGWLAALGWSGYAAPARVLRVVVVALVGYLAVTKLLGLD